MSSFSKKANANLWRLLAVPMAIFLLAALEVTSGNITQRTLYLALACLGISTLSAIFYFICDLLYKIHASTKMTSNLWRLLLIPFFIFFFTTVGMISGVIIEGTTELIFIGSALGVLAASGYFICGLVSKIHLSFQSEH